MSTYHKGDWLNDADVPDEDMADFLALDDEEDEEEEAQPVRVDDSNGGAAGCVFGVALIALSAFVAWALTQVGGVW